MAGETCPRDTAPSGSWHEVDRFDEPLYLDILVERVFKFLGEGFHKSVSVILGMMLAKGDSTLNAPAFLDQELV